MSESARVEYITTARSHVGRLQYAYAALVEIEREIGDDDDEAAAALHQALQDGPRRVEAFTLLGDVLAAQGDRTGAAALIRHAAEGRPSDLALRRRLRELSDA